MKRLKFSCIFLFVLALCTMYLSGCKTAEVKSAEPGKKLPGSMAMNPSSFRCEGVVIESNSQNVNFKVTKMLGQGSSLFYPVSAGDTLVATFQSPNKANYSPMQKVELMIEERIMLNSEKPEFIVREIF